MEDSEDLDNLFLKCNLTSSLWKKLCSNIDDFANISSIQTICTSLCSLKQASEENVIKLSGGAAPLVSMEGNK